MPDPYLISHELTIAFDTYSEYDKFVFDMIKTLLVFHSRTADSHTIRGVFYFIAERRAYYDTCICKSFLLMLYLQLDLQYYNPIHKATVLCHGCNIAPNVLFQHQQRQCREIQTRLWLLVHQECGGHNCRTICGAHQKGKAFMAHMFDINWADRIGKGTTRTEYATRKGDGGTLSPDCIGDYIYDWHTMMSCWHWQK